MDTVSASSRPLDRVDRTASCIAAGIGLVLVLAVWLGIALWPAAVKAVGADSLTKAGDATALTTKMPRVHWLGSVGSFRPDQGNVILILAFTFGLIGASVNTAWTLSVRVGNRSVGEPWMLWNALAPILGAALALLVHMTFSAKLFGLGYDDATLRPETVAVISSVAGLSSTTVRRWLRQRAKDRLDKADQDDQVFLPVISDVSPPTVPSAAPAEVRIVGTNFGEDPKVAFDGTAHDATVDANAIVLSLTIAEVGSAGTKELVVTTKTGSAKHNLVVT